MSFNSGYVLKLNNEDKKGYLNKLQLFGTDPFEIPLSELDHSVDCLPLIDHADIINYLVFSTNTLTKEQIKAYKSLESHNYFTSGWVDNKILTKLISGDKVVLLGKVKHSQSLRSPPLKVWIAAKSSGEIITAHCTCMAGMGEACSHVGAILFAVQNCVKLKLNTSCTEVKNTWLPPSNKVILYSPVCELDFRSSKRKMRDLDEEMPPLETANTFIPEQTELEFQSFLGKIAETGARSAVLSVVRPFNKEFIIKKNFKSHMLGSLFQDININLPWTDMLKHCKDIFYDPNFQVTESKAREINAKTRLQTKCKDWFLYRAGRITASNMAAVCKTKAEKPSLSLLKKICYPNDVKFSGAAVSWGCSHEKIARAKYHTIMKSQHEEFSVEDSGFCINKNYSHIGASPDGIVMCNCCGKGLCEIKCPFCARNHGIEEVISQKHSCLIIDELGNVELDKKHAYYFQVQTQLFVCDVDYCDLVIWTKKDIHIERIFPNFEFWEEVLEDATYFFLHAVLPELTGKWFSKQK